MSDTQSKMGKILSGETQRDAVHVAVAPVFAHTKLWPGQHVGVSGTRTSDEAVNVGIIDPFLTSPVFEGQQCYLYLYPNTIQSLNHVWTHPAFKESEAEQWLRFFAQTHRHDYEAMLKEAVTGDMCFGDTSVNDIDDETKKRFWDYVEEVTGRKVHERLDYFRCAC